MPARQASPRARTIAPRSPAEMARSSRPRLLIFELRQLGDAVQSLPFIRGAMECAEVYLCCQPGPAALYEKIMDPARIIRWSPPWGREGGKYRLWEWDWRSFFSTIRRLREVKADRTVSVWADARDHLLMLLSGAGERFGFPMNERNYYAHERSWRKRQLKIGRVIETILGVVFLRKPLSHPIIRADYLQNHIQDWAQLADAMEVPWKADTPWLPVPERRGDPALAAIAQLSDRTGQAAWLIHPGARMPNRRWAKEHFERLLRDVFEPAGVPHLIIVPAECEAPAPQGPHGVQIKTADLDALLAAIDAVGSVLCNDTGVSHLAAAMGKKVVTLFSSNRPEWFAPFENLSRVVENNVCPFRPCLDRCLMPSYICLEAITVEAVAAQVRSVIARSETRTPQLQP
jgi:ADP-heptose:LPS heptosyltransferase